MGNYVLGFFNETLCIYIYHTAISALTLSFWHQEMHLSCKNAIQAVPKHFLGRHVET